MMLIDYYFIMIRKVGGSDAIRQFDLVLKQRIIVEKAFGLTTDCLKW